MVEHRLPKPRAAGSTPVTRSKKAGRIDIIKTVCLLLCSVRMLSEDHVKDICQAVAAEKQLLFEHRREVIYELVGQIRV